MTFRRTRIIIVGTFIVATFFSLIYAQNSTPPATAPSGAAPTTNPSGPRRLDQIMMDVQKTGQELDQVLANPTTLFDVTARDAAAPKAIPLLKTMGGYAKELAASSDPRGQMMSERINEQVQSMLAMFGEPEATAALEKVASGSDASASARAKSIQQLIKWVSAGKDPVAQKKIVDETAEMAKSTTNSNAAISVLTEMASAPSPNTEVTAHAKKLLTEIESARPPKSLDGKPLTIKGTTVDGKTFSSDDWRGKVVLVDFWATWCGPCIRELPRVKKVYAEYHDKGLEIIGVSNDYSADELSSYVSKDPGMPWPQLFDPQAAGKQEWNPITTGYGINSIPVMFLIDRKGIVRSVTARDNFEKMIPELLAEAGN